MNVSALIQNGYSDIFKITVYYIPEYQYLHYGYTEQNQQGSSVAKNVVELFLNQTDQSTHNQVLYISGNLNKNFIHAGNAI